MRIIFSYARIDHDWWGERYTYNRKKTVEVAGRPCGPETERGKTWCGNSEYPTCSKTFLPCGQEKERSWTRKDSDYDS